ncbi:MAG TPA: hypothetical protein VL860_13240, partial [Planctomycetota bacterium]|nr:hypothetical protein [Planctomycetota bacterium]
MTTRTFRFSRPLNMGDAFNRGFTIYKANAGLLIGAGIVTMIMIVLASVVVSGPRLVMQMMATRGGGAGIVFVMMAYLVVIETP